MRTNIALAAVVLLAFASPAFAQAAGDAGAAAPAARRLDITLREALAGPRRPREPTCSPPAPQCSQEILIAMRRPAIKRTILLRAFAATKISRTRRSSFRLFVLAAALSIPAPRLTFRGDPMSETLRILLSLWTTELIWFVWASRDDLWRRFEMEGGETE